MADGRDGTDDAALAAVARHALHDEELVAADAAGGLESDAEVAQARALVDRCIVCRDLHRDVAAIGAGLRAEATFAARAPRDFRLTADDARRLGGRVSRQGVLVSVRRMVVVLARPVGASLATFGLVGLLIGSMALGGGGAATYIGAPAASATAASAENVAGGTQPLGPKATTGDVAFGPLATEGMRGNGTGTGPGTAPANDAGPASWSPAAWLLAGSVAALLAGVVLLLIAFRQGRRRTPRA